MHKLILKTKVSLDGFMEGPGGAMDWFSTDSPDEWEEMFKLFEGTRAVLLGRGMYDGYAQYWRQVLVEQDKHPKSHVAYARWADKTRHIVFSRTLAHADWVNTEIRRDAIEEIPMLKRETQGNLLVFGGANFASTLIERGLVDEYHLIVEPVVLGGGKRLFHDSSRRLGLKRTLTRSLSSGAVWLSYEPAK
jgi:dihydrofolate reductase